VTTAWGDWHVGHFLSTALPSLLSDGNLPELCKAHELTYELCTTRRDAERMAASPAYAVLDTLARVEIQLLDEGSIREPVATHHRVWLEAVESARSRAEIILLIPPDAVWADGALRSVARRLAEGKLALFNTYLRTNSDTFVPALLARAGAGARLCIDPRELVDLGLQHLHPLMSCYLSEAGHLPEHAEFLLWPVPGEGLLLRLLARELMCFDPVRIRLTDQALLAELPDPERLHLFTDSDELCAVSLTPPWKDSGWYREHRRLDPVRIAAWWLAWESPANDLLCRRPVRFHRGIRATAAWRAAEEASGEVVDRILASRSLLRLCRTLRVVGMDQSALALAVALFNFDLAQTWKTPATLFLPTNRALSDQLGPRFRDLLREDGGASLRRFVGAHTVEGRVELGMPWSSGPERCDRQSFRDALGRPLEVDASCDPPRAGSARVVGHAFEVDGVRIYPIDAPFPFGAPG
jgi:hypothetical protein